MPSRLIVGGFFLVSAALLVTAVVLVRSGGLPGRIKPEARAVAAWLDYRPPETLHRGHCTLAVDKGADAFDLAGCLPPAADRRPRVLLYGDSHSASLWQGLDAAYPELAIGQASGVGCVPRGGRFDPARCRALLEQALAVGSWRELWLQGRWQVESLDGLGELIDWARAQGLKVVVIGPNHEYQSRLPGVVARAIQQGQPDLPQRLMDASRFDVETRVEAIARAHGADYVSLIRALCEGRTCPTMAGAGEPLMFDRDHFTPNGSLLVGRRLRAAGAFR